MKLFTVLAAALQLAATTLVAANQYPGFYVYGGKLTQRSTNNALDTWAIYPDHQGNCTKFRHFSYFWELPDVSKDFGFACDYTGCVRNLQDPLKIDRLEMNVKEGDWKGHYTWYKHRGNALVDLKDQVVGHCVPVAGLDQFFCGEWRDQDISFVILKSYFFCNTTVW